MLLKQEILKWKPRVQIKDLVKEMVNADYKMLLKHDKKNDKIFLAGHNGLVGSAILKLLKKKKFKKIITVNRNKLDLFDQKKVESFLKKKRPKIVIIAAARVGGINANNNFKADFIRQNLQIQNQLNSWMSFKQYKQPYIFGLKLCLPKI